MQARRVITVVGCHAEGEIGDVITGGVLPPAGADMLEKKLAMEREHDNVRRLLIQEPRGSVARHVNLIVPPTRGDCVAGAIVMEPTEYPPMSGSNTMCIATVLLETGIVPMAEPVTELRLDMPAGPVDVIATCARGKVTGVTIRNVPAMALKLDAALEVAGLGTLNIDISYGGMIFAIVDAKAAGFAVASPRAVSRAAASWFSAWASCCRAAVTPWANRGARGCTVAGFMGRWAPLRLGTRRRRAAGPDRTGRGAPGRFLPKGGDHLGNCRGTPPRAAPRTPRR